MAKAIKKLERLSEIKRMLSEKAWQTQALANHFDCKLRDIQRDIAALKHQGCKIEHPKKGWNKIAPAPTHLQAVEALAVHAATRLLYHHTDVYSPLYLSALKKLAGVLPEPARAVAMQSADDIRQHRNNKSDRNLEFAARAWFEQKILRFDYSSANNSHETRRYEIGIYFIE